MLAADQRLRRSDDFGSVIRRGRRAGRDGLVVHVRQRDENARPRAGFVIPRAVGSAVIRNKVRRRLRHLLSAELPVLRPGTDVVVRVLPAAAQCSHQDLARHLRAALAAASRPQRRTEGDSNRG